MRLAFFFAATYAISWLCWLLAGGNRVLILIGVFTPGIVALILGGTSVLARLVKWDVGLRWYVFAVGYIFTIKLTVAVLHRIFTGAWPRFGDESIAVMFAATILSTVVGGQAGEEIGWRGFALPRLQERYGALAASLLLGLVWAAWHLPLWFVPGQEMPPFLLFVPNVVALSVVLAWLYNGTQGSLLIVALAHTANNVAFRVFGQAVAAMPADGLRVGPLVTDVAVPVAMVVLLALLTDPRTLTRRPGRASTP